MATNKSYGRLMKIVLVGMVVLLGGRCYAESGCFHSVAEAARRVGVRDEGGFRVEGVRRDVLSGLEWVRVARCGRPEVPAVLVFGGVVAAGGKEGVKPVAAEITRPVVVAGDAVRVVWAEGSTRGDLAGIAVASGRVGALVRVRVEAFTMMAEERLVAGVVRAAGVVELEMAR